MATPDEGVELTTLLGSVLHALSEAKRLGDLESARMFDTYKKETALSPFTVPAFTIADVECELRFVVQLPSNQSVGPGGTPNLRVNTSPEVLKTLEAHHITVMKIKFAPVSLRVFEQEGQD